MKLSELPLKQFGVIEHMDQLDRGFVGRLMDMGIYPDATISVIKVMARGSMYIVEVDDVEICIRKRDAERIIVK